MPRGGRRAGAGRNAGSVDRKTALKIAVPLIQGTTAKEAVTAAAILASVDEKALWLEELGNPKNRLAALMYLTDKRDGKAKSTSDLNVKHEMAGRSEEELKFLVENGFWPEEVAGA
jgi:hypothetical protein